MDTVVGQKSGNQFYTNADKGRIEQSEEHKAIQGVKISDLLILRVHKNTLIIKSFAKDL